MFSVSRGKDQESKQMKDMIEDKIFRSVNNIQRRVNNMNIYSTMLKIIYCSTDSGIAFACFYRIGYRHALVWGSYLKNVRLIVLSLL